MLRLFAWFAAVLTLVGALNWGLVGLFRFNLVHALFGPLERTIYALVGISSIFTGFLLSRPAQEDLMSRK